MELKTLDIHDKLRNSLELNPHLNKIKQNNTTPRTVCDESSKKVINIMR